MVLADYQERLSSGDVDMRELVVSASRKSRALVYGHFMPHKENTNPPVRKIVIGVPEYLGAQIQVEFEMPEPSVVAEVCGVVLHKK